jgi:hypothetical protein
VARRDRALAAVDPSLVAYLERHNDAATRLVVPRRPAAELLRLDTSGALARLDVDAWGLRQIGELAELREVELAEEIHECLDHHSPQALLRDLHRSVQAFGDVELRRVASPTSSEALTRARSAVRSAMAERAGSAAEVVGATRLGQLGLAELRAVMAMPWADARPEQPLPLPSRAPSLEDAAWFGLSGGYDPDV